MASPKNRIRTADVGAFLGVSAQVVRVKMRKGLLPIGQVVKEGNGNYNYLINPKDLYEQIGMKANGYEPPPVVNIDVDTASIVDALIAKLLDIKESSQ